MHGNATTALHLDVIRVLVDAGADATVHDATHDATPAGWAEHGGHTAAVALLTR